MTISEENLELLRKIYVLSGCQRTVVDRDPDNALKSVLDEIAGALENRPSAMLDATMRSGTTEFEYRSTSQDESRQEVAEQT